MVPNSSAPTPQTGVLHILGTALLAIACGLALGVVLHLATSFLDGHGPVVGPLAFNGNGSLVVPFCVGPIVLVAGVVILAMRRAFVAMVAFVIGLVAGFIALGSLLGPL